MPNEPGGLREHTLVSGRGLVDGIWHPDVSIDARVLGFEERFLAGRFSEPLDLDDLRNRPWDYHLYVAYPCPFAHRVILARALLGVTAIGMSVCHPCLTKNKGWIFAPDEKLENYLGLTLDEGLGKHTLHEVYTHATPRFTGRVTVPALLHLPSGRIVSNDSFKLMAAFAKAFDPKGRRLGIIPADVDSRWPAVETNTDLTALDPLSLAAWVADRISVGVYRAGMARTQHEYEQYLAAFFKDLDRLEGFLASAVLADRYGTHSLASLILLATWVRWDLAYRLVMYLTARSKQEYPAIARQCANLLSDPTVAATVREDQIIRHYVDDDAFVNRRLVEGRYLLPIQRLDEPRPPVATPNLRPVSRRQTAASAASDGAASG
ncbi:MAG: hypothetical protein HKN11_05315 [Rhizobiales bacterium]|nr:hypothetical protein [Hyphomicrobiales bacterium]